MAEQMLELDRSADIEASDDVSASHQLLEELQASQTPRAPPALSSAARGASLLNAARHLFRRPVSAHALGTTNFIPSSPSEGVQKPVAFSSPGDMGHDKRPGKLKRPSIMSANLAKSAEKRRTSQDVYEMPESPEKRLGIKPLVTVNHEAMKVVKRGRGRPSKKTEGPAYEPMLPSGNGLGGEVQNETEEAQEAEAEAEAKEGDDTAEVVVGAGEIHQTRKSGLMPDETIDNQTRKWERRPQKPLETHRSKRQAKAAPSGPARPTKSSKRHRAQSASLQTSEDVGRRTRSQRKVLKSGTSKNLQRAHETIEPNSKRPRTGPAPQKDATFQGSDQNALDHQSSHEVHPPLDRHRDDLPSDAESERKISIKRNIRKVQQGKRSYNASDSGKAIKDGTGQPTRHEDQIPAAALVLDDISEDEYENAEEGSEDIHSEPDMPAHKWRSSEQRGAEKKDVDPEPLPDLSMVFQFLDSSGRKGTCKTKEGLKIIQACKTGCIDLTNLETSLSDVIRTSANVTTMIGRVGRVRDKKLQEDIKADAYGYLFRFIARYLEAVVDCLRDQVEESIDSLSAVQIISSVIDETVAFKDTIASWKVQIGQRFAGDRIVKDVDQNFIVPLRDAQAAYSTRRRMLEHATKQRRTQEELLVKRQEQDEERLRKEEALKVLKQRWVYWQHLHLCRNAIETDPSRLRHLRITSLSEFEERDANGVNFERLPLFKDRVTPPAHRTLSLDPDNWTDAQTGALIDGLRDFAGPGVFERIFDKYCVPYGPLREFNVTEITAQAKYIRSILIAMDQSRGQDTEKWVLQIPSLP